MIVNGKEVDITQNLGDALRSLRLPDRSRLLWVDAICINQSDNVEKSAVVATMGDIYRNAETVAIFLGIPTDRSGGVLNSEGKEPSETDTRTDDGDSKNDDADGKADDADNKINKLGNATDDADTRSNNPRNPFFDFLDRDAEHVPIPADNVEAVIAACGMDVVSVLTSFVDFCRRDWWTRVWVMQEHFVAAREPRWYVGRQHVGSDRLCRDIQAVATAALRVFSPFGGDKDVAACLGIGTIGSLADVLLRICDGAVSRQTAKPFNTPRLFFAKHDRLATDPRDHVYGVRELLEPHFRRVFVPDYSVGVGPLFERLAAWLLLLDGWGDMFWYYPFRPEAGKGAGLPSWVPDFAKRPKMLVNEREPPKYLADDPKTVHCAIVDRRLYIDGCHLDVIEEVFPVPDGDRWHVLQYVWRMDRVFCSNQRDGSVTGAEWPDRTLFAWATTMRPTTAPLASRWREMSRIVDEGMQGQNKIFQMKFLGLLDAAYKEAKEAEAVETAGKGTAAAKYRRVLADILAAQTKETKGMIPLHRFLAQEMEGDFPCACIFDYDNLDAQLQVAMAAADAQQGINSILSTAGPRDVVYVDLLRAIEKNSCGTENFKTFAWVMHCIAEKIHSNGNLPARSYSVDEMKVKKAQARKHMERNIGLVQKHLKEQRDLLKKLEDESRSPVDGPENKSRIEAVKKKIRDAESCLDVSLKDETRRDRINEAEEATWERLDEEKAVQFRGREFFVTRSGLFGLTGPGVGGVRPGDGVVLLDGLTFPLIVRDRGDSWLAVVGCAKIRGVELKHKVEEVEVPLGTVVGPKETLVFV